MRSRIQWEEKKQKNKTKKPRQKNSASCRNDTRDQVGLCLFVCLALHNSLIQIRRGHGNRRRALTHTKEPRDTNVQKRKRKKKRWCAELPTLMSLIAYCLGLFREVKPQKATREKRSAPREGETKGLKKRKIPMICNRNGHRVIIKIFFVGPIQFSYPIHSFLSTQHPHRSL